MYNTQEKLRAPADFDGPVKDRKCTDVLFTLLIVAMWVAMTIVGITSIQEVCQSTALLLFCAYR